MTRRDRRAFSLVEIMLAVVVAGVVLSLILPLFLSAGRAASFQTSMDMADRQASRALTGLIRSLRHGRIDDVASSPDMPAVTYRTPDEAGGVDDDGDIVWGPARTLAFRSVGTIDEKDRGVDINGDGDREDVFCRCRLVESIEGASARDLTGARFLLNANAPHGDVNGDDQPDTPFTILPGGLRIVLWSLIRDDLTGLRRSGTDVTLRNPQTGR